jgi:hypothetical protein
MYCFISDGCKSPCGLCSDAVTADLRHYCPVAPTLKSLQAHIVGASHGV